MRRANDGFAYRERIGPHAAGASVLDHLAARYPHASRDEWAQRIHDQRVSVDGVPAAASDRLRAGQQLVWHRPPWQEPPAPRGFAVLYTDGDVLAVAKPSGLPTVPGGGFLARTLLWEVRRRFPGATPLHRLGRHTSGVVLFARSEHARRALARAWRAGGVTRLYRARVVGRPAADTLTVTAPIGPVPHPLLASVHAASAHGRQARTTVRVIERGDASSLVEVRIWTGRPHQIRIHLAAAGHPLVGDRLYGPAGLPHPSARALPGDGGYLLHAARLGFPDPRSAAPIVVECFPPPGLRGAR